MNKEEIEEQLKLSKRQNKDKRYDYLDSEFNAINYCIKLEKYTNKLLQENKKYKEVIDKAINWVEDWTHGANDWFYEDSKPSELLDILKEVNK